MEPSDPVPVRESTSALSEETLKVVRELIKDLRSTAQAVEPLSRLGKHPRETDKSETNEILSQLLASTDHPTNSSFLSSGNSLSLAQVASFAAPEAAPESWLTLADDPSTASFAHMISNINETIKEVKELLIDWVSSASGTDVKVEFRNRFTALNTHLDRTSSLVKMQARAFSLKTLLGPMPGAENAMSLLYRTEALNKITGENISIADVAKLRSVVNVANKLSDSTARPVAAARYLNLTRQSWGPRTMQPPRLSSAAASGQQGPTPGPCYACGQYGHVRANCPRNNPTQGRMGAPGLANYFRR